MTVHSEAYIIRHQFYLYIKYNFLYSSFLYLVLSLGLGLVICGPMIAIVPYRGPNTFTDDNLPISMFLGWFIAHSSISLSYVYSNIDLEWIPAKDPIILVFLQVLYAIVYILIGWMIYGLVLHFVWCGEQYRSEVRKLRSSATVHT